MFQKALAYWRTLTPGQQVMVIVALVIVFFILRNVYKTYKQTLLQSVNTKTEAKVLEDAGMKLSYSSSKYPGWADELFAYMDGPGTKVGEINRVFSYMKNDRDILELEKAFGLRLSSWSSSWFTDPTDLQDWLKGDLSEAALGDLNAQLSRQGINKKF
jgi:NADPH-dependent 7-cyano-7-deazaguanine reductase QueF-like protein